MASMRGGPVNLRIWVGVEMVGACLVLVAAAVMPWATYRLLGASSTMSLRPDSLSHWLIPVTAVALVIDGFQIRAWHSRALAWTAAAAGAIAVALSVVEAARRISHANSLTLAAGGSTSYSWGSAVAVVGALAMSCAAIAMSVVHHRPMQAVRVTTSPTAK